MSNDIPNKEDTGSISIEVPNAEPTQEQVKEKAAKRPRKKAAKGVAKRKADARAPILNADSRRSLAKGLADLVRTDDRILDVLEMTFRAALSKGKTDDCEFTSAEIVDARRQLTKIAMDPELVAEGRNAKAAISINITGIGMQDSNANATTTIEGSWEVEDDDN